jgi:unsaturated chondroitin disaccharide hydrolase
MIKFILFIFTCIITNVISDATFYYYASEQVNATIAQIPKYDSYPIQGACSGCYEWSVGSASSWVSGFFSGTLASLYEYAVNNNLVADAAHWLNQALLRNNGLAVNQFNTGTHDVGFIVFTSIGRLGIMTNNQTAKDITIQTAHSLSTRFAPSIGAIQSWGAFPPPNKQSEVIADNMMNLELLWWSGQQGNTTFTQIATSHADKMITDLFQRKCKICKNILW